MKSEEPTQSDVPEGGRKAFPESEPRTGSISAELKVQRHHAWVQALVLAALFSAPALVCVHEAIVMDPDVWWHMRSGEWILQHGVVPHTEPFSIYGAGKPWTAYSWLFEVLIFQLFQRLGLTGLVAYTAGMVAAITMALHRLNRRLQGDFSIAVLLTLAGSFCLMDLWTPRSWLFTILFFVLELDVLMQARRTGKTGELFWLPVIFAFWANMHIQFVVGLLVLGMALGESVLARWWSGIETRIGPARLCGIFIACILATLANPYGWTAYRVAYDLAGQHGVLSKVSELQAMPFRDAA